MKQVQPRVETAASEVIFRCTPTVVITRTRIIQLEITLGSILAHHPPILEEQPGKTQQSALTSPSPTKKASTTGNAPEQISNHVLPPERQTLLPSLLRDLGRQFFVRPAPRKIAAEEHEGVV